MRRSVTPRVLARLPAMGQVLPALLGLLLLAGCSSFREIYPNIDRLSARGDYEAAAQLVESHKDDYGERNEVLYQLDRGVLYHYAGKYKESNTAFARAEQRMDELFTESITGNVAAFAVNDNLLPYRGEDFESVITNIYQALNYAQLGNFELALVQARKVDQKLDSINRQYEPDKRNVYKEDAFARMLMGALYQISGSRDDLNDAYISNKLALGIYEKAYQKDYGVRAPPLLASNLLTSATFMGAEEVRESRQRVGDLPLIPLNDLRNEGQLYVVHFAGRAPIKVEAAVAIRMPDGNIVKLAFPVYRRASYLITGSQVLIDGQPAATLGEAEPIGPIAITNLDNRKGRIMAKAVARVTTKYLANRAIQQEARRRGGEGAGLLAFIGGNIAAIATEQADLRAWQTLPDRILMGRALLTPGKHRVAIQFTTGAGAVVATKDVGEIEVPAGRARFLVVQSNT